MRVVSSDWLTPRGKGMTSYRVTDLVSGLPATVPFVGPEAQERAQGRVFEARIGANENMFGPSPAVIEAIIQTAGDAWMYGDPELHELRHAIARHHEIPVENVAIGEGIDGLLGYFSRIFIEPGDSVVTSAGAYPTFNYHVVGYGGKLETVPYRDDHEDIEGLLNRAADVKAKLLYVANPDNPMGTWWGASAVDSMMSGIPEGAVLLLDEAYGEFADADTLPAFDIANENVLRFRTFSKAYGMAGIRVGYVVGHCALIGELDKVRNHFGVGRVAQAAALAALKDQVFLTNVIQQVRSARTRIVEIARENGLSSLDSAANFVAIDCGADGEFAMAVLKGLLRHGIFVRMPGIAPLNRCIRITAGKSQELDAFARALPVALGEARAAQ